MNTILYKIVPVLLLLFSTNGLAQNEYIFRHIDIANGLSDNQIRNLTMLSDGRLAVRTASILNLYNGAGCEYFVPDKKEEYFLNNHLLPREYIDSQNRMWLKGKNLLLLDQNTNRFIYNVDSVLNTFGIRQKISDLFIDNDKNFWFVEKDSTVSTYNISEKKLKIITKGNDNFTHKFGVPLAVTQHKNRHWIVYQSGLLQCRDALSGKIVVQDTHFVGTISPQTDRLFLLATEQGNLWLMYNFAVYYFHQATQKWTKTANISGTSNFFTCMDLDKQGNAWIGTSRSGLRLINGKTFDIQHIKVLNIKGGGFTDNDIHCILANAEGGIWIDTLFQGLYYYHSDMQKFTLVQTVKNQTATTNEVVRCFIEQNDGTVLTGTANGLFYYQPATQKLERIFENQIQGLVLTLFRDSKKRIWVGTYLNGFFLFDGKNLLKRYNFSSKNMELFPNQNVSRAIYEDSQGRFWVSAKNQGIGLLNLVNGEIDFLYKKHPQIKPYTIAYRFFPTGKEEFAVLCEEGIYFYNTLKDSVFIPHNRFFEQNIRNYCLLDDSRSLLWLGTETGLRIWDKKNEKYYLLDTYSGLPNSSISAIEEDSTSTIWVSNIAGISRITVIQNAENYEFNVQNFTTADGLQSGKFYDNSSLQTSDGTLYFGGVHGFNTFRPETITFERKSRKPLFTGLKISGTQITEYEKYRGHIILNQPISNTKEIRLQHNENYFTLEFSGLNYLSEQTSFRYKMENSDHNWTEITTNGTGTATYNGLHTGKYIFRVATAQSELAELTIIISPPLWANPYAYALYTMLLLVIIWLIYRYFDTMQRHIRKIIAQQMERLARKKIEPTLAEITLTPRDEQFLQKALQCVEKNINNRDYQIEHFCNDLNISRAALYRKFESITGASPTAFIRSIRLKRAAQLLRNSDLNISEILEYVGFHSQKYFNLHFKNEFGQTPSEYRKADIKQVFEP